MWSEDHRENNRKMHGHSMVWGIAWMLSLLVVVTVAAVGTCFYAYVYRSDCQISLHDGWVKETTGVIQPSASEKTADFVIESRAARYSGKQVKQQLANNPFELNDSEQVWETETTIELFQTEYRNAEGVVTVKSADGEAVIAPGTEGQYTFRLENTSDVPADYVIWMDTKLSVNMSEVPIQIKIDSDSGWILGDEDHWIDAEDLNGLEAEKTMNAGKATEYTIYWQWPFERESDMADTDFGDVSLEQGLSYTVTIHTLTTEAPEDNPSDSSDEKEEDIPSGAEDSSNEESSSGEEISNGDTLPGESSQTVSAETGKTGDDTQILFWGIVFVVSFGILFLIFVLRKRKNGRKNE